MIVVLNRGFDDGFEDEKVHKYCELKLDAVYTSQTQKATLSKQVQLYQHDDSLPGYDYPMHYEEKEEQKFQLLKQLVQ